MGSFLFPMALVIENDKDLIPTRSSAFACAEMENAPCNQRCCFVETEM